MHIIKLKLTSFLSIRRQNPRDEVMASLNNLLFRIGVDTAAKYNESELRPLLDADHSLDIRYTVMGDIVSQTEVFHSDFGWFAGAAALELFCILSILITFYGWWDLGECTRVCATSTTVSTNEFICRTTLYIQPTRDRKGEQHKAQSTKQKQNPHLTFDRHSMRRCYKMSTPT